VQAGSLLDSEKGVDLEEDFFPQIKDLLEALGFFLCKKSLS
jgi:hypothetical protein